MIENKVKLVIWDLDETFWKGTLTEGGIEPIPRNQEIVLALSRRGIVNSICSKNDYDQVKARLADLGIWDYFVFPHIQFSPKGQAVAEMLENAGLRAENTLFIDDNPSNLEEVKFFNTWIMTAHPAEVLEALLDHPHCAGKPDPDLTRLKQYRFLQRKAEERSATELSNEQFLRASNIRVDIDCDVEANFDRVVELINRTNQLNYTKRRLNSAEEIEQFRQSLEIFGYHAGCVRVRDNYGDYGLVGFFQMKRKPRRKKLIHFVFSCRAMNMGIEQYIYRLLEYPELDVVRPVSCEIDPDVRTDWINAGSDTGTALLGTTSGKLVLLGGCDLLQLASYCSTNRVEFVNRAEDNDKVRYDDPGFILSERSAIQNCGSIREFACWTHEEAVKFDEALATTELAIVSLWPGMNGYYYSTMNGDVRIRLSKQHAKRIRERNPAWFEETFRELSLAPKERLRLIVQSLDAIAAKTAAHGQIFLMGCCTHAERNGKQRRGRNLYNSTAREYCNSHATRFHYVDVDSLVSPDSLLDKAHFTRQAYFGLARHILASLQDTPEDNRGNGPPPALLALPEAAE